MHQPIENEQFLQKFDQIMSERQFNNLSEQIGWTPELKAHMFNGLYRSRWADHQSKQFARFKRDQANISEYQSQYRKWKQQQQSQKSQYSYQNAIKFVSKIQQDKESQKLAKQYNVGSSIVNFSHMNSALQGISRNYKRQASKIVNEQNLKINRSINKQGPRSKQSVCDVQPQQQQRPTYELRQNIIPFLQQQGLKLQRQLQKQIQIKQNKINRSDSRIKQSCFVNLISHPPNKLNNASIQKSTIKSASVPKQQLEQNIVKKQQPSKKKSQRFKLNIAQVLKIPPRLFLIFYSDNYHQILRLSTPQQLKMLDQYRKESLQKQAAIGKLKKKLAQSGPQLINCLPSASRQKLFRVLYEQDLQIQKWNDLH